MVILLYVRTFMFSWDMVTFITMFLLFLKISFYHNVNSIPYKYGHTVFLSRDIRLVYLFPFIYLYSFRAL